jgi:hypothetical protein
VKAIVAVEPNGPAFYEVSFVGAPDFFKEGELRKKFGLTFTKVSFDPPVTDPGEIEIERAEVSASPEEVRCWVQKEPARVLTTLKAIPTAIVTGEASFRAAVDGCSAKFLRQAGVKVDHIKLKERGIMGNAQYRGR